MNSSDSSISIWEGVFQNYQDAIPNGSGFSGDRWAGRILEQLFEFRKHVSEGSMVLPPRSCDLPFLCSIAKARSILDFGGSSGWHYDYLKFSCPKNEIDEYCILEIEPIVELMKRKKIHSRPVNFSTKINKKKKFDVLYANSSLQYVRNDLQFTDIVNQTSPTWILIEDFLGGDFSDFFSLQTFYADNIQVKIRNKSSFISRLQNLNYQLVSRKAYPAIIKGKLQELPMSAIPERFRVKYGENFLFKKDD